MINQVVLVGRVVKELDLKYTQSGKAVARFNLAVNRTTGLSNKALTSLINQLIHSVALVSLLILVMMTFRFKKEVDE